MTESRRCDNCDWSYYDRTCGSLRCRATWAMRSLEETGKLPKVPSMHQCHDWRQDRPEEAQP